MSAKPVKSARQLAMEECRKNNQLAIVNMIKKDLSVEKNATRKKNIEACLLEAQKVHVTGSNKIVGVGGKANMLSHSDFCKKFKALDVENRRLLYAVGGTAEQMTSSAVSAKASGPTKEQMMQVTSYSELEPKLLTPGFTGMHRIYAKIRLPSDELRDDDGKDIQVAFDTGSEVQSIEKQVWESLAGSNGRNYTGVSWLGSVGGATGAVEPRRYVQVEICYFRDAERKIKLGDWHTIQACLSNRPYEHNLSGAELLKGFHFIIPKGNPVVIMGTSKPAVIWEYLSKSNKESNDVALIQQWAAAQVAAQAAAARSGSNGGR
ncbi:hypothetical protein J7T55_002477 [Diaporthe amygdali]|uniref:uncharacterized protein n=1 Tax=Phomopsis amygdali TaxID=1214568 RepID=UPI0022FDC01C|nr:uncharacterized protein J7T55_002477 [Diaporthe amygdali]KAJ0121966.1 hypothetical protein J7T55_002477 [Diaporthe amygdali]